MSISTYEKNLLGNVVRQIEKHKFSERVCSVILSGSFGRGEPTYLITEDGFKLKSDVEIALVYESGKREVKQLMSDVSKCFAEELNFMPLCKKRILSAKNYNYDLGEPKYKTLFTFDLFNGSKTIAGEKLIEKKNISVGQIDAYEAKRIVANRIGELIYISETADDYTLLQWKSKVVLAIISAWLLCRGEYVSSYHAQMYKVKEREKEFISLFGAEFLHTYYSAFSFLRENGSVFTLPNSIMRKAVDCFYKFYKDNYGKSTSKTTGFARKLKYTKKFVKHYKNLHFVGIEDIIIERLILFYINDDKKLSQTATMWHNVIY